MKKGDILNIKGRLGFTMNPKLEVMELKGGMVKLRTYPNTEGGLLSHMNESWHAIDLIEQKL